MTTTLADLPTGLTNLPAQPCQQVESAQVRRPLLSCASTSCCGRPTATSRAKSSGSTPAMRTASHVGAGRGVKVCLFGAWGDGMHSDSSLRCCQRPPHRTKAERDRRPMESLCCMILGQKTVDHEGCRRWQLASPSSKSCSNLSCSQIRQSNYWPQIGVGEVLLHRRHLCLLYTGNAGHLEALCRQYTLKHGTAAHRRFDQEQTRCPICMLDRVQASFCGLQRLLTGRL